MREITQQYLELDGEIPGDCWRACLAILLDLDIEEVPHFLHVYPGPGIEWWHKSIDFVEEKLPGWTLVCVDSEYPVYNIPEASPRYVIASGQSPRGAWDHAVIADASTGEMVWDVHPSGAGILTRGDVHVLTRVSASTPQP